MFTFNKNGYDPRELYNADVGAHVTQRFDNLIAEVAHLIDGKASIGSTVLARQVLKRALNIDIERIRSMGLSQADLSIMLVCVEFGVSVCHEVRTSAAFEANRNHWFLRLNRAIRNGDHRHYIQMKIFQAKASLRSRLTSYTVLMREAISSRTQILSAPRRKELLSRLMHFLKRRR